MEPDEPIFDAHDNFVAGTAIRIDGNWHIPALRPGAGVIVRVNTGRCARHELRPQENRGSICWTVGHLIGGTPMTLEKIECQSAVWQLPEGGILLVMGSTPGDLYRLVSCKDGLLAVNSAARYESYLHDLLNRRMSR
jgi:hypothetical protein